MTVKFELFRNKPCVVVDSFDGQTGSPNTKKPDYKIVIKEAILHVPVAVLGKNAFFDEILYTYNIKAPFLLDSSIFNEYEANLRKHVAKVRFRRLVVRTESVPIQTQNYDSTILFNPVCMILIKLKLF